MSEEAENRSNSSPQVYILSSQDQGGISRLCEAYSNYLGMNHSHSTLHDLSFTLATKRTQFRWRSAIVASSKDELVESLSLKQTVSRADPGKAVGFVFTGQGAQWARMGVELLQYSIFKKNIQAADAYFKSLGSSWSAEGLSRSLPFHLEPEC